MISGTRTCWDRIPCCRERVGEEHPQTSLQSLLLHRALCRITLIITPTNALT